MTQKGWYGVSSKFRINKMPASFKAGGPLALALYYFKTFNVLVLSSV